jgi:3-hydroxybutyryl-CoA dehydrogenase
MADSNERTAVVVGGGTMGTGIAYVLAVAGYPVAVVEPDPDQAAAASDTIASVAAKAVERGRLDPDAAREVSRRVSLRSDVGDVPRSPYLAVEAVPERVELKRVVLAAMQDLDPQLLATNTSGLSISALGSELRRPERFLGMHFFNPVWSMPLVEIVVGERTADDAVAAARALTAEMGKESIVVRDTPGFATSRLGIAIGLEAMRMLEEGVAEAADIDKAMELGYRHPMGPLRLTDLVGLDVRLDIARHLEATLGPRFAPPDILVRMVEDGRLGKKVGRGIYDWSSS